MQKLIAWFFSLPFLMVFSAIMVGFDLLMRLGVVLCPKLYEYILRGLCRSVLWALKLTGFRWQISGKKNLGQINKKLPVVIVSNHQSLMDIPMIILACKNLRPRFVSKEELAKFIPFVSYALRSGGHAIINRKDRSRALKDLKNFVERIKNQHASVCIFPEGTRARDGKIQSFKTAGLVSMLQQLEECTILPIAISNSWRIAQWKMLPVPLAIKVQLKILQPINYSTEAVQNPVQLIEEIRERISSGLV